MFGTTSGIYQQTLELLSTISASGLHEELSKTFDPCWTFLRWGVNFFLIRIVEGGIQLVPLGTAATNGLLCQPRVIMMMEKLVE
jgi:hypothetical protein